MNINKKRIVITGGTSGIGYELIKILHPHNELIIISRNINKLQQLQKEFENILIYQANLSRMKDVEIVANAIVQEFESIDILINNAAVQYLPTFIDEQFEYESIAREITVNFTSVCSLTYLLLPTLLHQKEAVILNVNSGLSLAPKTSSAIYCATKGALNIFTQSLRYQLEHTNINVQQVFLELVDTAMTQGRGRNKMNAATAACEIIDGLKRGIVEHDIGKVKWLRLLLRVAPFMARKMMKKY